MEEFLATATPNQLLLCLAGPVVGAVIFGGILFLAYRGRSDKKQAQPMTLGASPQADSPPALAFAPAAGRPAPPEPTPEPPAEPDAPLWLPQALAGGTPGDVAASDLNLAVLSHSAQRRSDQKAEMEDDTMALSRQPREDRIGLAARINSRSAPVAETAKPAAGPPPSYLPPSPPPVGQVSQPASRPQAPIKPAEPVELLRLLRDPRSGQLMVEIAGRRYTKLAEISDKKIGEYMLKLAAHLLAFTNGMIATEAGLKSLPAPRVGATPVPPPPAPPPAPPLPPEPALTPAPEVEAALLATLVQPVKPAASEPPPRRRGLFGRPKPAQEEPLLPALNLAQQINDIAQARLRLSPLAATTKLEITSDPAGGIRINVNGRFYASPDEIAEPEVKALIKASIQQWEKS